MTLAGKEDCWPEAYGALVEPSEGKTHNEALLQESFYCKDSLVAGAILEAGVHDADRPGRECPCSGVEDTRQQMTADLPDAPKV